MNQEDIAERQTTPICTISQIFAKAILQLELHDIQLPESSKESALNVSDVA